MKTLIAAALSGSLPIPIFARVFLAVAAAAFLLFKGK